MKRILCFITAAVLITLSFTGCTNTKQTSVDKNNNNGVISDNNIDNSSAENHSYHSVFVQNSRIYMISEDGSYWTDITPKKLDISYLSTSSVYFYDRSNGWMVYCDDNQNTYVYRTNDAGSSWQKAAVNKIGMGAQLSFITPKEGWLMLHQGAAMMHDAVAILHTTDGGITWNDMSASDPDNIDNESVPFVGGKYGFGFINESNGWIAGYEPVDGIAYLLASKDGGATWETQNIKLPNIKLQGTALTPIVLSDKACLIPVQYYNDSNKQVYVFYKTEDAGESWALTNPPPAFDNIAVYSFYDDRHGYITDGSTIYTTDDQGETWNIIGNELGITDVQQLFFVNNTLGWLITDKESYRTTDGGKTWLKEETPMSKNAKESATMENFSMLFIKQSNLTDVISFIDNNISAVSPDNASNMLLKLEELQNERLKAFQAELYRDEAVQNNLLQLYAEGFDINNPGSISNSNTKAALSKIRAAGYKLRAAEGMLDILIDYSAYKKYGNYTADDIKSYIDIMSAESDKAPANDAALTIGWDELLKRALKQEKFITTYGESSEIANVKHLYDNYVSLIFYGADNTLLFDSKTKSMKTEAKAAYSRAISDIGNSQLLFRLSEFMNILKDNNYKLNSKASAYRDTAYMELPNDIVYS